MPTEPDKIIESLTVREIDTLLWLAEGHTYPEIATKLKLSYETVKGYMRLIRKKTAIRRKTQLAIFANMHAKAMAARKQVLESTELPHVKKRRRKTRYKRKAER